MIATIRLFFMCPIYGSLHNDNFMDNNNFASNVAFILVGTVFNIVLLVMCSSITSAVQMNEYVNFGFLFFSS